MKKIISLAVSFCFFLQHGFAGGSLSFTITPSGWGSVPDNSSLEPGSGGYTISMWMKKPDTTTYGILLYHWDVQGNLGYAFRTDTASTRQLLFFTTNDGINTSAKNVSSVNNVWAPNRWEYIALVKTGTVGKFYVNGNVVGDDGIALDASVFNSTAAFVFGNVGIKTIPSLFQLSNVRIYNRSLSASEVAESYRCADSPVQGLVGNWSFTDSTFLLDNSGRGNQGTFVNALAPSQDGPPISFCNGGGQ